VTIHVHKTIFVFFNPFFISDHLKYLTKLNQVDVLRQNYLRNLENYTHCLIFMSYLWFMYLISFIIYIHG